MPNGTYGGVRGKGAKAKTLAPRPTRYEVPPCENCEISEISENSENCENSEAHLK